MMHTCDRHEAWDPHTLGQLGQDEPASGCLWIRCWAPLLYVGQMSQYEWRSADLQVSVQG